jgi:hypothetical protein
MPLFFLFYRFHAGNTMEGSFESLDQRSHCAWILRRDKGFRIGYWDHRRIHGFIRSKAFMDLSGVDLDQE